MFVLFVVVLLVNIMYYMKNSRSVIRLAQVSDHCSYGLNGVKTKKKILMSTCRSVSELIKSINVIVI